MTERIELKNEQGTKMFLSISKEQNNGNHYQLNLLITEKKIKQL